MTAPSQHAARLTQAIESLAGIATFHRDAESTVRFATDSGTRWVGHGAAGWVLYGEDFSYRKYVIRNFGTPEEAIRFAIRQPALNSEAA